jgi:hypothetical protein
MGYQAKCLRIERAGAFARSCETKLDRQKRAAHGHGCWQLRASAEVESGTVLVDSEQYAGGADFCANGIVDIELTEDISSCV